MCDKYSAKEQNLGFLYQSRLALIEMLNLNEDVGLYVERRDDLEYVEANDQFTLASLKHKKEGEKLTDLSKDFWKSLIIWLQRYLDNEKNFCNLNFVLFTTNILSESTLLNCFKINNKVADSSEKLNVITDLIKKSNSETVSEFNNMFMQLNHIEKIDFFG